MVAKKKRSYFQKHEVYGRLCPKPPAHNLHICIVIPCFDEPDIISTLTSICGCKKPSKSVEIIIVINHGIKAAKSIIKRNEKTEKEIQLFIKKQSPWIPIHIIVLNNLPEKVSGVGMARKVGMDEAARRLPEDGIILCLDADCTVEENYIRAIEHHFEKNKDINGCSVHFSHPLNNRYPEEQTRAIAQYELHLRYFIDKQRRLSLPYAYHTVGSSMAVKNKYYQQAGGMNKRKAGEDFYFIHKLVKQGKFSNCTTTTVILSARTSDRVPFGTGKAMKDILNSLEHVFYTYHPESFEIIDILVERLKTGYHKNSIVVPDKLLGFFNQEKLNEKVNELITHTSNEKNYLKRLFHWFDAFLLMKTLHHLRDFYYPLLPVLEAVMIDKSFLIGKSLIEILDYYRELDKQMGC